MTNLNVPSHYIFLSPHPDDVVLSCGGWVWQLVQAGARVEIWTICAGDPPDVPLSSFAEELHARWAVGREALAVRREEDIVSCKILGAEYHHLEIGDCIYRRHPETGEALYASEAGIFGEVHSSEEHLLTKLTNELRVGVEKMNAQIVCPLGLGGHVDHRFTRRAAEQLDLPLWYYLDYPYVLKDEARIPELLPVDYRKDTYSISEVALSAWQDSVAAHRSQISTFWPDDRAMQSAIEGYGAAFEGIVVYQPVM